MLAYILFILLFSGFCLSIDFNKIFGGGPSISEEFAFMKGTVWRFNDQIEVTFHENGGFEEPNFCSKEGACRWEANDELITIHWKRLGEHRLIGNISQGLMGIRDDTGERVRASYLSKIQTEPEETYYDILGLEFGADEAACRGAYRKLAAKVHPDRASNAEEKELFNANWLKIAEANEILSDPEKKYMYDSAGMDGLKKLEEGEVERAKSIKQTIQVSLEDLYLGRTVKVSYARRAICKNCRNNMSRPDCVKCTSCPKEIQTVVRQMGPGFLMQQQIEVPSKEKCKSEKMVVEIEIEKGMSSNGSLTHPGKGNERPGFLPGELILGVKQTKHPVFQRQGPHLTTVLHVSVQEALLGFTKHLVHLDKRQVKVSHSGVAHPGEVILIPGEGMPRTGGDSGNLLVTLEIDFPTALTDFQRDLIRQLDLLPVCSYSGQAGCQKPLADNQISRSNASKIGQTLYAVVTSCRSCQLERLPEVKRFLYASDGFSSYSQTLMNWIQGAPPVLQFYEDEALKRPQGEPIDLSTYTFDDLHSLMEDQGFLHKKAVHDEL